MVWKRVAFALIIVVLVVALGQVVNGQNGPRSFYPLEDGVPFANQTTQYLYVGYRFVISPALQANQDVLFELQSSGGGVSMAASTRPDMLTSLHCNPSYPSTYYSCRVQSCAIPSHDNATIYISVSVQPQNRYTASYNITATVESQSPLKVMAGDQFTMQLELWQSQNPICYWNTALISFDASDVMSHSTLIFANSTLGNGLVAPFFVPSSVAYGFPVLNPAPQHCYPIELYAAATAQGYLITPSAFEQAYLNSQNDTDWYFGYLNCVSSIPETPPTISGTVYLISPASEVDISVSSTTATLTVPQSNGTPSFSYVSIDAEGLVNPNTINMIVDYSSGSGPISFYPDTVSSISSLFTLTQFNTTFEESFLISWFPSSLSPNLIALYTTQATEPAMIDITLFNHTVNTRPVPVDVFPSHFDFELGALNFFAAYEVHANSSQFDNVTVCIPPWPILESPSAIIAVAIKGTTQFCKISTPLPSQQNPYNPYCVEIQTGNVCDNTFTVTISISALPRELGDKIIPMNIEFGEWQY